MRRLRIILPMGILIALGCFWLLGSPSTQKAQETQNPIAPSINETATATNQAAISQTQIAAVSSPKTYPEKEAGINFTLTVAPNTYSLSVPPRTSVFGAMQKLSKRDASFVFSSKEYSGLGQFVESIGNIKNENGAYWTLYINGKMSSIGASQYQISPGDKIEWKFEKLN